MFDLGDLVDRAKDGDVTERELRDVAHALERGDAGSDTYKLIYILVRSGARQYAGIVSRYIAYERDPHVAGFALRSLVVQWDQGQRLREELLASIRGRSWDHMDELKQAAIGAAGEHLRSNTDCLLLTALLDAARSDEDEMSARFAAEALARALGEQHLHAMSPKNVLDRTVWTSAVIARAESRLIVECEARVG